MTRSQCFQVTPAHPWEEWNYPELASYLSVKENKYSKRKREKCIQLVVLALQKNLDSMAIITFEKKNKTTYIKEIELPRCTN